MTEQNDLVVFTDFEYLNEWMDKSWKFNLENPDVPMNDFFQKLGGYEGLKKAETSLVQFGGVLYDIKNKKIVDTLNINIKHDEKTAKFIPTQYTYNYAHKLCGVWFNNKSNLISLDDAAKLLRKFIGEHRWVIMDNDFNVIKRQLPSFASDRKEPLRLKPLLLNTRAKGYNSGKLYSLLTDKEKELTGWNESSKLLKTYEHTGCYDALSMAVYCAINQDILFNKS